MASTGGSMPSDRNAEGFHCAARASITDVVPTWVAKVGRKDTTLNRGNQRERASQAWPLRTHSGDAASACEGNTTARNIIAQQAHENGRGSKRTGRRVPKPGDRRSRCEVRTCDFLELGHLLKSQVIQRPATVRWKRRGRRIIRPRRGHSL